MIPTDLEAVIFDMDGVLLDTEALYRTAMFAACADQGDVMPDHVHLSLIGTPRDMGDVMLAAHFGDGFDLDFYHAACRTHFTGLCHTGVPLRPGVLPLLDCCTSTASRGASRPPPAGSPPRRICRPPGSSIAWTCW